MTSVWKIQQMQFLIQKAVSDAKLWHARFGHLNFASLLRLQKSDMVASLPTS